MTSEILQTNTQMTSKSSHTNLINFLLDQLSHSNFPGKSFIAGISLALSVVIIRRTLITHWGPPMSWMDNPYAFLPKTFLSRWLSLTHIHSRYLLWLFAPLGHSPNYGWDTIPPVMTLGDPRNILTIAAYLLLIAGVCTTIAFRWWRELGLIVWSGCLFMPASNVFFYVGTAFADRLLYLPSVPFCILLGCLFHRILEKVSTKKIHVFFLFWAAGAIIVFSGIVTSQRLPWWRNGEKIWEISQVQFPRNIVAIHNLALDRQMHNRQMEAAALFGQVADVMETSEFAEPRGDRLVSTGKEAKLWAERSAAEQKKLAEADPQEVLRMVQEAVKELEEGRGLVGPFALMRDVLLEGVMEGSVEVEDWILKNTFALHAKHNRLRDLFQIVRVHVIPRRKRLFLDWSVPKEIVDLIAPTIDGEI